MGFKIEREEYVNKTFRIEKKLVEEMEKICDKKKHFSKQVSCHVYQLCFK